MALATLIATTSVKMEENRTHEECALVLRQAASCGDFWVMVHAVEFLAKTGFTEEAKGFIKTELLRYENVPQQRIGVWRSVYLTDTTKQVRDSLIGKIRQCYTDTGGKDRVHAVETLAKLGHSIGTVDTGIVNSDIRKGGMMRPFVMWALAIHEQDKDKTRLDDLLQLLNANDDQSRKLAAYAMGYIGQLNKEQWNKIACIAMQESPDTDAYAYLLGAAYSLYKKEFNQPGNLRKLKRKLIPLELSQRKSDRVELCRALAIQATRDDVDLLERLVRGMNPILVKPEGSGNARPGDNPINLDVKATAAYALLCYKNEMLSR